MWMDGWLYNCTLRPALFGQLREIDLIIIEFVRHMFVTSYALFKNCLRDDGTICKGQLNTSVRLNTSPSEPTVFTATLRFPSARLRHVGQ